MLLCVGLGDTWVLEHVRVETGDGTSLYNTSVVVKDAVVVGLGEALPVPKEARRIDATGKVLTPGLVESFTQIGMHEVGLESNTRDDHFDALPLRPAFSTGMAYNPRSMRIPIAREAGITAMVVAPTGGVLSGMGTWRFLNDTVPSGAEPLADVALFGNVGDSAKKSAGNARGGVWLALREAFFDARMYEQYGGSIDIGRNRFLSLPAMHLRALLPVLRGHIPLVLRADRASDIEQAVRFALQEKIRLVVLGGTEAWMVADLLRENHVPVVVKPSMQEPFSFEALHARDDLAAFLVKAGVQTVISTDDDSQNIRRLRQEAGIAVAYGLPYAEAIKAITSAPAKIFGQPDEGVIAVGKKATMVLWSGDPLENTTDVVDVYIAGEKQSTRNRQWMLMKRYQ